MNQKTIKTIADLKPPQPGQAQMIPFRLSPERRGKLWDAYQKRYDLQIIERDWESFPRIIGNTRRGCPVVYT